MMNVYKMSRPNYSTFARIREANMKYPPICSSCGRVGDRVRPLSISFKDEKPLGDLTWLAPDVFVSEKCKAALEKLKSPDFSFDEVEIIGNRKDRIWHLKILSKCKFTPECNVVLLEECKICGIRIFSTWDDGIKVGADCHAGLFRLEEHAGMIFVEGEIKNYLISEHITNVDFIFSEEVKDEFAYLRQRKI